MREHRRVTRSLVVVLAVALVAGCRSKGAACAQAVDQLDPITQQIGKIAKDGEPRGATVGDPDNCARWGSFADALETVLPQLQDLHSNDARLTELFQTYAEHVQGWVEAARRVRDACSRSDVNATGAALQDDFHHGAQIPFVIADVNNYCHR